MYKADYDREIEIEENTSNELDMKCRPNLFQLEGFTKNDLFVENN